MSDYIKELIKQAGKDKLIGDKTIRTGKEVPKIDIIPTGIEEIDYSVIGSGGIPRGRITQLWGEPQSGKSTMAGQIVASMQRSENSFGGTAVLLDSEGKYDPDWWEAWGVNTESVIVPEFNWGEEAFANIKFYIGKVDLIVLDSIGALVSKEDMEREDSPQRLGSNARMLTHELSLIVNGTLTKGTNDLKYTPLKHSKTALLFINQIRDNIGVMYGEKHTRAGGNQLDHLCSLIIKFSKLTSGREQDEKGGVIKQKVSVVCNKNNFGPPMRRCELLLNIKERKYEAVNAGFILDKAVELGILERRGAWVFGNVLPDGKLNGVKALNEYFETENGSKLKDKLLNYITTGEVPVMEVTNEAVEKHSTI